MLFFEFDAVARDWRAGRIGGGFVVLLHAGGYFVLPTYCVLHRFALAGEGVSGYMKWPRPADRLGDMVRARGGNARGRSGEFGLVLHRARCGRVAHGNLGLEPGGRWYPRALRWETERDAPGLLCWRKWMGVSWSATPRPLHAAGCNVRRGADISFMCSLSCLSDRNHGPVKRIAPSGQ